MWGIKVFPALGEKNLAKNLVENDKKILSGALPSRRERGKFEKVLNESNTVFKINKKT